MNLRFILALVIFVKLTSLVAYSQTDGNEYLMYKKNKVESIKVYKYHYKGGKIRGKGTLEFYKIYDSSGHEVESFSYIPEEFHQKYIYDINGNLLEEIGYVLGSPVSSKYSYIYDNQGRTLEKSKEGYGGRWNYTFDSLGNQTKIKWLFFGTIQPNNFFVDTFEFDNKNRKTKMIRFRPDHSIYFNFEYYYDSTGNMIGEKRFENGKVTDMWSYTYDLAGNRITNQIYDHLKNEIIASYRSEFTNNGLMIYSIGNLSSNKKQFYHKYFYKYFE